MNSEGITIKAEGYSYQLKKIRDKQHLYHHSTAPTSLFVAYVKILHDVFVMIPRCLGSGRKQMSLWKFCFIFSDRLTSSSIFFFVILLLFPSFWEKKYTFWSSFNEVNLYPECKGVRFFSTNLKLECAMK